MQCEIVVQQYVESIANCAHWVWSDLSAMVHFYPLCGNINNYTSRSHLVILVSWISSPSTPKSSVYQLHDHLQRIPAVGRWSPAINCPRLGCWGHCGDQTDKIVPHFHLDISWNKRISVANIFTLTSRSSKYFLPNIKSVFIPFLSQSVVWNVELGVKKLWRWCFEEQILFL